MRIDSAVSLIFLLVGWAAPPAISQDSGGPGSRNSHSVISAISVAEHADSVAVEVTFNELVQPEVRRLDEDLGTERSGDVDARGPASHQLGPRQLTRDARETESRSARMRGAGW